MSTQRDQLAEVIKPAAAHDYWPQEAARLVLAAGWTLPRTFATVKELAEAEEGTVVRSYFGNVYVKDTDLDNPDDTWWSAPGTDHQYRNDRVALPALVLWVPGDAE